MATLKSRVALAPTSLRKRIEPEVLHTYSFHRVDDVTTDPWPGYELLALSEANLAEFQKMYPKEQTPRKHAIMAGRINHPVEPHWKRTLSIPMAPRLIRK